MADDLSSYMREHYNILIHKEATVCRRIIHATNRDLLEFVGDIANMAQEPRRKYPSFFSSEGESGTASPPRFTLLRELIGRSTPAYSGGWTPGSKSPAPTAAPGWRTRRGRWSRVRRPTPTTAAPTHHGGLFRLYWIKQNRGRRASTPRTAAHTPAIDCSYEHGQQLESLSTAPPPPSLLLSRSCSSSSSSIRSANGAPPASPSFGNGGVAWFSYHHASRGTPDGRGDAVEDVDRATEPLVDVVRGVRDDGTGPAAQRGRPGGMTE